ncbi:MAG TPA: hypothetical protein VJ836_01165 [Candidatus Saccharimonadales bacterium]|nr:hypothetical protein [Candidatus Saccharimonadales bacterium]
MTKNLLLPIHTKRVELPKNDGIAGSVFRAIFEDGTRYDEATISGVGDYSPIHSTTVTNPDNTQVEARCRYPATEFIINNLGSLCMERYTATGVLPADLLR